ncbi:MAG: transcription antitermination protein NusB [Flavobacteriales bacterium]
MLNRRQIRVKIMQALYGFLQTENDNLAAGEKSLLQSFERIYDLYLLQFALLAEVHRSALLEREDSRKKFLPTEEDRMESTPFTRNCVFTWIDESEKLHNLLNKRKLSWANHPDAGDKLFKKIRSLESYKAYIHSGDNSVEKDTEFMIRLCRTLLSEEEFLLNIYDDENIHWNDDIDFVVLWLSKSLEQSSAEKGLRIFNLYKDEEEDKKFAVDIFRDTILNEAGYEEYIREFARNWETERIAFLDMLLMKMAVSELISQPGIPVKVTLNEYIELSKMFSTAKSNVFINGILDKIVQKLKSENKLQKTGRGLIEN